MISRPLQLGDGSELFAMECAPADRGADTCVIMLSAGLLDQTGPYGLYLRFSEALAETGVASLRVDLNGKGESAERNLPEPGAGLDLDRVAIERYLDGKGYDRAVLMGLCSGAMDAVEMALRTDRFDGLILIDGFARNTPASTLRYYCRRLLRPSAYRNWLRGRFGDGQGISSNRLNNPWPNPDLPIANYRQLLAQGSRILAVYTRQLEWYYNQPGQLAAVLRPCEHLALLEEALLADADHIFTTTYHRRRVIELMIAWLKRQGRGGESATNSG